MKTTEQVAIKLKEELALIDAKKSELTKEIEKAQKKADDYTNKNHDIRFSLPFIKEKKDYIMNVEMLKEALEDLELERIRIIKDFDIPTKLQKAQSFERSYRTDKEVELEKFIQDFKNKAEPMIKAIYEEREELIKRQCENAIYLSSMHAVAFGKQNDISTHSSYQGIDGITNEYLIQLKDVITKYNAYR